MFVVVDFSGTIQFSNESLAACELELESREDTTLEVVELDDRVAAL